MSKSFLGFGIRRLDAHPGEGARTNATVIEEDYKVQEEEEEEEEEDEMEVSRNTSKRRGR